MTDKKRVLITGGAGFIGSHVADAYVKAGHEVTVLDSLKSGRRDQVPSAATFHELDIRSAEAATLVRELKPQVIIHLAAQMDVRLSTRDPRYDADVNIVGTLNLAQPAAEVGVEQFIFASSGGAVYGEQELHPTPEHTLARPVSPYGVGKLTGEQYLYYFHTEFGLNATCLRFANVYGERQSPHGEAGVVAIFLQRLLAGESCTINGDGMQTRDYVHVSDVVRATQVVLGSEGFHVYNVGTGVETTVVELYDALTVALGVDSPAEYGAGKPGEQRRSSVDATALTTERSWPTPLDLATGFARTAAWFREQS